jgi:hypothetical protein
MILSRQECEEKLVLQERNNSIYKLKFQSKKTNRKVGLSRVPNGSWFLSEYNIIYRDVFIMFAWKAQSCKE